MKDTIQTLGDGNKIAFVLMAVILLSVSYPLADMGDAAALIYLGVYVILVCSTIYFVSGNRILLVLNLLLTFAITLFAVMNIFNDPVPVWLGMAWNVSGLVQQLLVFALLVAFIIQSKAVNRKVLYAAVTIYFFMATCFATLFNLIEIVSPGAFIASSGAEITPTILTYFSLVTISTLGYGDIIPVAPAAQSLAVLESSVGTLYIAILIGRFVGLYQQDPS